jgi:hypothetical protein
MKCHHAQDRWGFVLSALCLIHCLALPALISMGYLWSFMLTEHLIIHCVFFVLALVIVYRRVKFLGSSQQRIKALFLVSLSLLFMGILADGLFHLHDLEIVSTIMGSCGLMAGHVYCEFYT